jgi:hypothetical protein
LVDFDGVLATKGSYPEVGDPIYMNILEVQEFHREGYQIVLYTSRDWWQEDMLREWCERNDVPVDFIICGKPLGIVVDDYSINPEKTGLSRQMVWSMEKEMNEVWNKDSKPRLK